MENNLTVIIPFYLENKKAKKLIKIVKRKFGNYSNLILVNDKFENIEYSDGKLKIINNKKNMGKFWAIISLLENVGTDYFLTIDPDDIFLRGIKWKRLIDLSNSISKKGESFDFGINTYTIIKNNKKKIINSDKIITYFNPNTIYNKNNIIKYKKIIGIEFENKKITYFEDVLLLLLSYSKGNKTLFNDNFYTYVKDYGVTNNPEDYIEEIIEAKKQMDKILSKIKIKSSNIKEKRMKKVVNSFNSFINS